MLDGLAFVKAQKDHGARPEGARVLGRHAGRVIEPMREHLEDMQISTLALVVGGQSDKAGG